MKIENCSENFNKVLSCAEELATACNCGYIASEHLVYAMFGIPECGAYRALSAQNLSLEKYKEYFMRTIDTHSMITGYTPRTKVIIEKAIEMSKSTAKTAHLLLAVLTMNDSIAVRILRVIGADFGKLIDDALREAE